MLKSFIPKTILLIALLLLFTSLSAVAAGVILKDGITVEFFNDSPWYIKNGEWTLGKHSAAANENKALFVSIDVFNDALGCKYYYDEENKSIYIKGMGSEIWQAIDYTAMFVNNTPYDHPAPYINEAGSVMIPLEPYASVFGFSAVWETPEDYLPGKMTITLKSTPYVITRLEVNKTMQMVTVFGTDPFGNIEPVKHFICSTGIEVPDMATPEGTFKANPLSYGASFDPWYYFKLNDCWVLYCTQVIGNVCFHSVPVDKYDMNYLSSSAYNNLGNKASHGCIRLFMEDAEFIWKNCRGVPIDIIKGEKSDELSAIKNEINNSKMPFKDYLKIQKEKYPQVGKIK